MVKSGMRKVHHHLKWFFSERIQMLHERDSEFCHVRLSPLLEGEQRVDALNYELNADRRIIGGQMELLVVGRVKLALRRSLKKFLMKVKEEHQRPPYLLQPISIPEWKWEDIVMDFVVGFPRTPKQHDSAWVIIDRFTKSAHFLPVKTTYPIDKYVELYDEVGEKQILGPEAVREATKVVTKIRQRILTAQSMQKSSANLKRRELEFLVGDQVFLRVSPMKGVMNFWKKGKLIPMYIGLFEILERVGQVAYCLALPPGLAETHNVFHISKLRKYVLDPSHVLSYELLELKKDLSYDEQLVQILEIGVNELSFKKIPLVKVLWENCLAREST
ncbi:uncharacterized protein LOC133815018 [Humulus lupulus]|uniref:uncharacterized protein LOC133815018 n=1 Tax=Humulus lupulus TaxID=3486 RepID=UPI002B414579|nr:uncharacterized protein LOC133815018 [Humulus lupulus]